MKLVDLNQTMKDLYPEEGTRIKQWVVDLRAQHAWERETCPTVRTPSHRDNTDAICRNAGSVQWLYLIKHDCCRVCNDLGELTKTREDIAAWLVERAARPPVCEDRTKFSDQIQPRLSLEPNPIFKILKEPT